MAYDRQPVLDFGASQKAKSDILEKMEAAHGDWVAIARATAMVFARENGEVTADDVRAILYPRGYYPRHYNAWGAVFKSAEFEFTGEYRASAVPAGKGNMQRVWRLR